MKSGIRKKEKYDGVIYHTLHNGVVFRKRKLNKPENLSRIDRITYILPLRGTKWLVFNGAILFSVY